MGKRILITGANGMIGNIILQKCLPRNDVLEVRTITRKRINTIHPKLNSVVHDDFLDYRNCITVFNDIDICFYCLGVYRGTVPNDEFFRITCDYTKAFSSLLLKKNPHVHFCFLSSQGADLSEKSRFTFAKAKGMAENILLKSGFTQLAIFRPGYIYPVQKRVEPNIMYAITRLVYPVLKYIYPNIGVTSVSLANAMIKAGCGKAPRTILNNRDIRNFMQDNQTSLNK